MNPDHRDKKATIAWSIAVAILAVLVLCCGTTLFFAFNGDGDAPKTQIPRPAGSSTSAPSSPSKHAALGQQTTPKPSPRPDVKMPNLKGQNGAVAQDTLVKLGFTSIRFGTQDAFDSYVLLPENWTVVKQSVKAGQWTDKSTLIVLTCTKTQ